MKPLLYCAFICAFSSLFASDDLSDRTKLNININDEVGGMLIFYSTPPIFEEFRKYNLQKAISNATEKEISSKTNVSDKIIYQQGEKYFIYTGYDSESETKDASVLLTQTPKEKDWLSVDKIPEIKTKRHDIIDKDQDDSDPKLLKLKQELLDFYETNEDTDYKEERKCSCCVIL